MGRPRTTMITRKMATDAALAVIDAEGLKNFSLNLVARAMNVKAPSLYYYFSDKDELLAEVARTILAETPFHDELSSNWEEWTVELCIATRRALLAHPHAAVLILQFFPRHLLLDAYEHSVKLYPRTQAKHMAILEGIEKLTFGSALFAAAAQAKGIPGMPDVDPAEYPALAASVAASGYDDEGTFIEALRMLLAGIRQRTEVGA